MSQSSVPDNNCDVPNKGTYKKDSVLTSYVFTLNNYTDAMVEAIKTVVAETAKYLVFGYEIGDEEKTPHLQGYCKLKKRTKFSTVCSLWDNSVEKRPWLARAITVKRAINYCKKDNDYWEHGECPIQGTRNDVALFLQAVRDGQDDDILASEYPNEFVKYYKAAQSLRATLKQKLNVDEMIEKYKEANLREWQAEVVDRLEKQDDRKVLWVQDTEGNLGKSWLANWLVVNKGAYLVEGGKRTDIAHAYNYEKTVVFDYTRSQEEQVNYSIIESFKNGRIFAPKYESKMKIFNAAKVLALSNFEPDITKLSDDRWDIVRYEGLERQRGMKMRKKRKRSLSQSDSEDECIDVFEPPKKKPRLIRQNANANNWCPNGSCAGSCTCVWP